MTVSEVAAYLRAHDKYLILTHRRPDGDTLGCAAALCAMLRQMGKTAGILYNRETTEHFEIGIGSRTILTMRRSSPSTSPR